MTTTQYICSLLSFNELMKIGDAMSILRQYGMHDVMIEQDINAEIEKHITEKVVIV